MYKPLAETRTEIRRALHEGTEIPPVFGPDRETAARMIRNALGPEPSEGERMEAALCGVGAWNINIFDAGIKYLRTHYYEYGFLYS